MSNWKAFAACRDLDPNIFFDPDHESEAKAHCADCPVADPCLDLGLALTPNRSDYGRLDIGVFGGMNDRERVRESRRRASEERRLAMRLAIARRTA